MIPWREDTDEYMKGTEKIVIFLKINQQVAKQ